jgi:hypothetical protein
MPEGLKPCPHRKVDESGRILCGLIRTGDREVSVNLCRACPVPQINCQHLRASMAKKVSTPITVRYATGRVEIWDDEAPTIGFRRAACAEKTMPIRSPRDCVGCPLRAPLVIPTSVVQVARRNKPAAAPAPIQAEQSLMHEVRGDMIVRHQPVAAPPPSIITEIPAQPVAQSSAAQEMVARAQELAANKYREAKRAEGATARMNKSAQAERSENKSKIILLQQWLADQFNKKSGEAVAAASQPDQDGVQDIVYSPLAPSYHEDSEYERCVGWTD